MFTDVSHLFKYLGSDAVFNVLFVFTTTLDLKGNNQEVVEVLSTVSKYFWRNSRIDILHANQLAPARLVLQYHFFPQEVIVESSGNFVRGKISPVKSLVSADFPSGQNGRKSFEFGVKTWKVVMETTYNRTYESFTVHELINKINK